MHMEEDIYLKMKNREWKMFCITDIFNIIYIGDSSDSGNLKNGTIPFVGRTSKNNGYENNYDVPIEKINRVPAITVSLIGRSTAYYQEFEFATSQNILILRNSELNKDNGLFLVTCINNYLKPFLDSYGLPGSLNRVKRAKILLPSKNKLPDWDFMEEFTHFKLSQLKMRYKIPENNKIIDNRELSEVEWGRFILGEIFTDISPGRSKGMSNLKKGKVSYLGATNRNNGVLNFVQENDTMIQKGNALAFIRNGEGSIGYSIYKKEDFIATSDISVGYHPKLNTYTGTFITTVADKVRGKYSFGYKRSNTRLKKETLLLPIKEGYPDFEFMEQYMKRMENNVLEKAKKMFD